MYVLVKLAPGADVMSYDASSKSLWIVTGGKNAATPEQDLDGNALAPQHADGDVGESRAAPGQRAEAVEHGMARLAEAGGDHEQQEGFRAEELEDAERRLADSKVKVKVAKPPRVVPDKPTPPAAPPSRRRTGCPWARRRGGATPLPPPRPCGPRRCVKWTIV